TISWFVYVVRLNTEDSNPSEVRDRVQADLGTRGIATGRYFAPIHLQPAWKDRLPAPRKNLALTESIARRTLALPFFNRIKSKHQQDVAAALTTVTRTQDIQASISRP
ncbi:MAG TPA: DegT/DnrJ/EryC1/StrS family aminotransferase, partial [Terracidiphilus sp.]|nr:DegT/DnrJ/EryC1/StrS family aminotransferase [Terracidiphilus sp.]